MTQPFQLTGKDIDDDIKYASALIAISDVSGEHFFVTCATLFSLTNALAVAVRVEEYEKNVGALRAIIRNQPPPTLYSYDNEIEGIRSMKKKKKESGSSSDEENRVSVITVSFTRNLKDFN